MRRTPLKKHEAATERKIEEAIARLERGEPINRELSKKVKLGTLRITISSVALEAGVSRTLIGHKNCPYPQLRARILSFRKGAPAEGTLLAANKKLRAENAEAKRNAKLELSLRAALLRRMRNLELAVRREQRRNERILGPKPHQIIGSSIEQGSVCPFPDKAAVARDKDVSGK